MDDMTYDVVLADPPYAFKNYSDKWHDEHTESKWVGKKYGLMTPEEIKALPVKNLSAKNSVLFLWATMPKLPQALETMEAWGWTFKTVAFTWVKTNKVATNSLFWGMGFWTRSNAEICLLGTRGSPKRVNKAVHSVIVSPVRKHSQKPDEVRERIVKLMGDVPRIELFARDRAENWAVWGDQVESDIQLGAVK